jgi:nicotinate-nucleotide adenylyltransferase
VTATARIAFPPSAPGLRVGLLGGSFNPPHTAHREATLFAIKRLQLDRVWWLVSPGNPLKDTRSLPSQAKRIDAAIAVANDPRIVVTGVEALTRTRYTVDTIAALKSRYPTTRFVWLMGADNLSQFHRWRHWDSIAHLVPLAVIDRPSDSLRSLGSRAAQALAHHRIDETDAPLLADMPPPAWVFLRGIKSPLSSTQLRSHSHAGTGQETATGALKPLTPHD